MLYRIGKYLYDQDKKLLVADGESSVTLKPKQAALLNVFIEDPSRWYTSTELLDLVWQNQVVENSSLYLQITNLRKQFGADALENEKNKGYRFCLTVVPIGDTQIPVHFTQTRKRNRIIGMVLMVLCLFVFGVVSLPNESNTETEDVKPVALTFMKGQEVAPSISNNYMAFTHRKDGNEFFSVYLQEKNIGAKPIEVLSATSVYDYYYPLINKEETHLYYLRVDVSETQTRCKIFKAQLKDYIVSDETEIADCGRSDWVSPFTINTSEDSLFYTYSNSSSSPSALFKLDLRSGYSQQISLPNQINYGDYNLALSPDNRMLAFSRFNSDGSTSIMSFNTELGTTQLVDRVSEMVNLMSWYRENLIYTASKHHIKFVNMESGEKGTIKVDPSLPIYDGSVFEEEFYFSQGKIIVSDIISTPDFGETYFDKIASPFTDDLFQCNQIQCYFISDRTSIRQLFRENFDGSVTQLSTFKQNENVKYLVPDFMNKHIYYLINGSLFLFDVETASADALLVGQNISSVAPGCKEGEYYVTRLENNVNSLYQVKEGKQSQIALLAEQVKVDCAVSEPSLYYLHSQSRALHKVNLQTNEQLVWINQFDTPSSSHWDVFQNKVIRLKGFYELSHWNGRVLTGGHFVKIPVLSVSYTSSGELSFKYTFAGEMTIYKQKISLTSG